MNSTSETCRHCGESIRFIRMGNSAKWSAATGNAKCAHAPVRPWDEQATPPGDRVWDRYTMSYVHVK